MKARWYPGRMPGKDIVRASGWTVLFAIAITACSGAASMDDAGDAGSHGNDGDANCGEDCTTRPDPTCGDAACGSDFDASTHDASISVDGATRDGSTPPIPVPCPSYGAHVPDDYATIQAAVDASKSTICIAAGSFDENVNTGSNIFQFIGAGPSTVVTGGIVGAGAWLVNMKVTGSIGVKQGDESPSATFEVVLDRVELASDVAGVLLQPNCSQTVTLTAKNSYFHGSGSGISVAAPTGGNCTLNPRISITLTNDTFVDVSDGVQVSSYESYPGGSVTVENSVFLRNSDAVIVGPDNIHWAYDHNALFDANHGYFVVDAQPGVGDITSDPLLDESVSPPAPSSASPVKGAASSAAMPPVDFFGIARVSPDIGAVNAE